jgi:hypothetical protein
LWPFLSQLFFLIVRTGAAKGPRIGVIQKFAINPQPCIMKQVDFLKSIGDGSISFTGSIVREKTSATFADTIYFV